MNFKSKDTSLRNMTHNTSIPNQIFSILCFFLAEISMKFHSKKTLLRNKTHNISIPDQIFSICADFWLKLVWTFIQKIPPWEICYITLLFKMIISWIFAYFWLKLSMKFHSNDTSLRNKTCNSSIENHDFMNFW